jgi:hypothetical protein
MPKSAGHDLADDKKVHLLGKSKNLMEKRSSFAY